MASHIRVWLLYMSLINCVKWYIVYKWHLWSWWYDTNMPIVEFHLGHINIYDYHDISQLIFIWDISISMIIYDMYRWKCICNILISMIIMTFQIELHVKHTSCYGYHDILWELTMVIMHDDVMKWKHFPCYWPFVWGIHRSPVNSPHKGQWRGALMFSLICAWINS